MPHKPHNQEARDGFIPELSLITMLATQADRIEHETGRAFADTTRGQRELELYSIVDNVFALMDEEDSTPQTRHGLLIGVAVYVVRWAHEERKTW